MTSQYLVKRRDNGTYDLYVRDLVSKSEYAARFKHLNEECGWSKEDTVQELYRMLQQFFQKNEKPVDLQMCERYIFDTMDDGDVIQIEQQFWIVSRKAIA